MAASAVQQCSGGPPTLPATSFKKSCSPKIQSWPWLSCSVAQHLLLLNSRGPGLAGLTNEPFGSLTPPPLHLLFKESWSQACLYRAYKAMALGIRSWPGSAVQRHSKNERLYKGPDHVGCQRVSCPVVLQERAPEQVANPPIKPRPPDVWSPMLLSRQRLCR